MGEQLTPAGLPDDLEEMPVGAELFGLLAAVDRRRLSAADQVRLARARNRVAAHVQGELLVDLYAVTRDDPPDEQAMVHNDASRWPWAEYEVAFALTWTHTAAGARLEQARQLVEELPEVLALLRAGRLDMPKVLVICDLLAGTGVARGLPVTMPAGEGPAAGSPAREGPAGESPADDRPVPAGPRATEGPAAAPGPCATEGPAAVPGPCATEGPAAVPGPRRGVVELQVPLTTLMSLTHLPGNLNGFGPVVADIARQTAQAYRDGA